MYTLYKSTNNISGKIFVGIEKDNKIVNMNLNYVSDYESIGSDFFDRLDLKKDILTIEDAYNKRDIVVVHLKGKGHSIYNFIDNDHIDQYGPKDFHETISKKYTFVYVTSNDVNNKLYVGSHTTDRLNDEYIGSGRTFLTEVDKIGKSHFKRTIIQFCETHVWAKILESTAIIDLREKGHSIYNYTSAGFGGNYGDEVNQRISIATAQRWDENYELMMMSCQNDAALSKRSDSVKHWIKNNQEAHMERMMKINTNPEKIRKTAEKHTGMKRTEENKANMSDARNKVLANASEEEHARLTGKGLLTVTNITDYTNKRVAKDYVLQENERFGTLKDPRIPLKKDSVITNILTWEDRIAPAGYILQPTERKGNKNRIKAAFKDGTLI